MAKKKKPVAPARPVSPRPAPQAVATPTPQPDRRPPISPTPDSVSERVAPVVRQHSENGLIRFDSRVRWFLGICVGLFLVLTLAKIHIVSVPMWNQIIPDDSDPKRGLISGQARVIRSDDYTVWTPWYLSQANRNFPIQNQVIGAEKSPILTVPVRHFSMLFKPEYWGALLLDAESGFAWNYNFRGILSIISITLLLLLLTQNNFWLSIFGSLWLFMSSAMQSWVYPSSAQTYSSLAVIGAIYLLYSRKTGHILIGALLFAFFSMCFIIILYPPFQVPFAYLMITVFVGYVANHVNGSLLLTKWPIKLAGFGLSVLALAVLVFLWYTDVKSTLDVLTNTVYPGKRVITGGDGFVANWFSEYFSWQVSDFAYPSTWSNYCEMAHYLTFTPLVIPCALSIFWANRRIDWSLALLILYALLMLSWIELGWPEWLGKITLMNQSKGARTQLGFGVGGVLMTIIYLNTLLKTSRKTTILYTIGGVMATLAFMIYAAQVNIADAAGFFKWNQLTGPIIFFTALMALLLPTWQIPRRGLLFGAGILLFLAPNLKINPISIGLTPITSNVLYRSIQDIRQRDPDALWVVFGQPTISYMVAATGVDLVSGAKFAPDFKKFRVLDPTLKHDSVYNRYAHTIYNSYVDPAHPDTILFQLPVEDRVQLLMDPCSPKLKTLGIKYVVFDHQPQPAEIRCMRLVESLGSIQIFQLNE